jgi:hypothetical protein
MAQRRIKRYRKAQQNPHSAMPILLLAGAGIAAYLAYSNGWFSSPTLAVAAPNPTPAGATTNPVTNPATQIVNAPSAPPPLGTVVGNANDIAAQAAAGLAYILPAQSLQNLSSLTPNGYSPITTSDFGLVFLRNNVYQVATTDLNNRIQRAIDQGAAETSVQNATKLSLTNIQQDMSSNGITGLGFTNGWGGYRM